MSDQLPNGYSAFPNNFPQGRPAQQAQHRPPQQPQQVPQPPLGGITNEVWQQIQYRQQQQQQQQQQHQHQQQQQQQPQQQQSQQSGGELMHGGATNLSLPQQQVCLPQLAIPLSYQSKLA